MIGLLIDVVATCCALLLGWRFREEMHTETYRCFSLTMPALKTQLRIQTASAATLTLLVLGGIWL